MKVVTHDGHFHTDEVVACMLLRLLYEDIDIIRTRDPTIIESADIVVDVGKIYDHQTKRYDHHQYTSNEVTWDSQHTIPLSSAGMVWKHYGIDIIRKQYTDLDISKVHQLHTKLYNDFFQEIDANDNGINKYTYNGNVTLIKSISLTNGSDVWNHEEQMSRFIYR